MRGSFTVRVWHGGRPLRGVSVEIHGFGGAKDGDTVFSGTTASDGTVHVGDLAPGTYWLTAQLLEITAASECFHVASRPSRKARRQLAYQWGDEAPGVREVAGRLIDNQPGHGGAPLWNLLHRVDVPISGAALKLQDPLTKAMWNAVSDQHGRFSFANVPEGLYVLHVDAGTEPNNRQYEQTNVLIELSETAKWQSIVLARKEDSGTSCGDTSLELKEGT